MPGLEFSDAELATVNGFARFVAEVRARADESIPMPEGWVHDTLLWLVDLGPAESGRPPVYLGRLSIRHALTDFLRHIGGHIGYIVRPSAQGRGLGTRMLGLALPVAAQLGIDPALVTCDTGNVASAKVILANGGVEDEGYQDKRRFWLPTAAGGALAAVDRQWELTRPWLAQLTEAERAGPSVLAGWTVADLVAHLGRSMGAAAAVTVAVADTVPLSFGTYVAAYAPAAEEIATGTRELAARTAADPLGALDRAYAASRVELRRVIGLGPVVTAPRGPIRAADFVTTRLLELVAHADDLGRSVGRDTPLDPVAVELAATALGSAWQERTPDGPEPASAGLDRLDWIRVATGRASWPAIAGAAPPRGLPVL